VAALAQSLAGVAYDGPEATVKFETTAVDDRGPGSAEKWSGADLVITAEISDGKKVVRKAILLQAKRGHIDELSPKEKGKLVASIEKMRQLTRSPKVLELGDDADRHPAVLSGNGILNGGSPHSYDLPDYLVRRVLTTMDGDTRPDFVENVQESGLANLKVYARKKGP
jgi:hypothetical protein